MTFTSKAFILFFLLVAVALSSSSSSSSNSPPSFLWSTLMAAKILPSHLYPLPSPSLPPSSFIAGDLTPRPCFGGPRTHFRPQRSVAVRVNVEPLVAFQDHHNSAFLLAESVGYSTASYYTSLGLFVISVPGLWSLIKRSVKSKVV